MATSLLRWGFSSVGSAAGNAQHTHKQAVLCLEISVVISYRFLESAVHKAWLIPDPVLPSDNLYLSSDPHFQLHLFKAHLDMACPCVQSFPPFSSTGIWYLALGGYMKGRLETA